MASAQDNPKLLKSLTPELRSSMIDRTERLLLKIVRANVNTQYASKSTSLAEFRDAISVHAPVSDVDLVADFRRFVLLSDYESYGPFMAAFHKHPCKEAELENLFAPGFPLFLAVSSATSGKTPKLFLKYPTAPRGYFDPATLTAAIFCLGSKETKEVEREPGSIVKKIPVTHVSTFNIRKEFGWTNFDDDDGRMSQMTPGFVAPWAVFLIGNHKSNLIIHALFALACRDLVQISTSFSTIFFDLMRHMDEEWNMLLSSIESGTLPGIPGLHTVRPYLQAHLHANPARAAELREIGPPFTCEGWAVRAWPKLQVVACVCSGPFATVLPQLKSIVGPTVTIRSHGYSSSESDIAFPHRPEDLDMFVCRNIDFIEFLDVTVGDTHENLCQAWELEVGKRYEFVLTTNNGLWRYRLDDVIEITGYDADNGSPVFRLSGRRNAGIRVKFLLLTDVHLIPAIQAITPDIMQINEFTTVLDVRESTTTVGYLVKLAGTPGPNVHLARLRLAEGLAAANPMFQDCLETTVVHHPTVRVLRPGTFTEYRQWKGAKMGTGPGHTKLPVAMVDPASISWIMERVIGEL